MKRPTQAGAHARFAQDAPGSGTPLPDPGPRCLDQMIPPVPPVRNGFAVRLLKTSAGGVPGWPITDNGPVAAAARCARNLQEASDEQGGRGTGATGVPQVMLFRHTIHFNPACLSTMLEQVGSSQRGKHTLRSIRAYSDDDRLGVGVAESR